MFKKKRIKKTHSGSMTVEAAFVLPLFLIAMILVGYILNMYYVHRVIGTELDNTCRTICAWSYSAAALKDGLDDESLNSKLDENGTDSNEKSSGYNLINIAASGGIGAVITKNVKKDPIAENLLSGSINCLQSSILKDSQTVDIVAIYELKLPFQIFNLKGMKFIQRSRMHAWVGYENNEENEEDDDEEYVYVAKNGTVYHRSSDCTYLKPSVRAVSGSSISALRNTSGAKYHACEICKPSSTSLSGTVYITTYGTRYHSSSSCSAIERNYKTVPLSQVEGILSPCSKCGGSH